MWEHVDNLSDEIQKVWCSSADRGNLHGVVDVLRNMQRALRQWSKEHFGAVTGELSDLCHQLDEVKSRTVVCRTDIRAITDRMDELLYQEEMMWLQHSRISWLREGDRNTSFFHRRAKWWSRKNKIRKLKRGDGSYAETPNEMKEMVVAFFYYLYHLDSGVRPELVLDQVGAKVTDDMNHELCKEFSEKEIADAMFQMGPMKAAGPDGFPARFYQRHWGIVKDDVVAVTRRFFQDGVMPEGINDTAIVLIPKGTEPEEIKDFRLISLCNVIYKLILRCIVNRLRGILDEIISPKQSAFVPTWRITDNALIAFECAYAIQRTPGRKEDFCAYKLDLSKAYDRVD
jgi:hypothetical protein